MNNPQTLSGFNLWVRDRLANLLSWANLMAGITPSGAFAPLGATEPVAASVTLTSDGNLAADATTVTIAGITYRAMDTPAQVNDFVRGASAAIFLDNLKAVVNGGQPALYYTGTVAHPKVTATTNTNTTQLFVMKSPGEWANLEAVSDSSGTLSWSSATFAGGTDAALKAVAGANASTTALTWTQATKTVAASGTPEVMAASSTLCDSVLLEGKNARGTNNTGNVWIGATSANDTQLLMIAPGERLTLAAPAGKKLDLNLIYIDVATNADGVIYTAFN